MAHLQPVDAFNTLKDKVSSTISSYFPLDGKKNSLRAKNVWVDDNLEWGDLRTQKDAKLKGRSWAVPVRAELELVDKTTGKVKDRQTVTLAQIPKITNRYSYIVGGNEYQVTNQFRLKAGAYTRVRANGELTTQWNMPEGGLGFDVNFDPKTKKMTMKHVGKGSNIALYPVLKAMGVDDDTIERQWGREIFSVNKKDNEESALKKYYKTFKGTNPPSMEAARALVVEEMGRTKLRPDSTKLTLGKPFEQVTGAALMAGSNKLLRVARQEEKPDDRDALQFKDLLSAEDLVGERLEKNQTRRTIARKITNTLDKRTKVREIVNPDFFGKPIRHFFTNSTLSERSDQTNPASFLVGNRRTTLMGEGGISSDLQLTMEAKSINPSHMGFLDPIQTPECYDKHTEVYTKEGWKPWPEVTESDLLACRSPGGPLMFSRPEALHVSHYEGKMYGLRAGKIEYLVTPNHRMFVSTPWCSEGWRIVEAPRVHGKERRFDCKHEPYISPTVTPVEEFHLPVVDGNNSTKIVESLPMGDWAEFMGWYLSEGSCQYKEDTSSYLVRVHQSLEASPDNYQRLQALMDRLPWNWSEQTTKTAFATGSKQLASYLKEFGLCYDKYIPDYFFDASVSVRAALLEALLLGDGRLGSNRADERSYKQEVYTTTSSRLADDVERLAISLGHSVSRSQYEDRREERYLDVHEVRLLQHRYRTARPAHPNYPANYLTVEYSGKVYCATVPGGLLYVRRGQGIGFWCGNSEKTGVSLQLAMAAKKEGQELKTLVHDVRRGKDAWITPLQALQSNLAFPDQYRWKGNKASPVGSSVKVADKNGEITTVKSSDVDYVMKSAKGVFDIGANMIPFLQNDQGNRTMMGVKQVEQAIGLASREAPLVQSMGEGGNTAERVVGKFVSQRSSVDGVVSNITKEAIYVKDKSGKVHERQIYSNFPLNDDKSKLHSEPIVKVGDSVTAGQTLADSNFTRNGTLALGTNLQVAYMPFKGYNFEDGIVISETAAKKLTSDHMFRQGITSERNTVLNKKKFLAETAGAVTKEQADKLDDQAIIKPGSVVNQGDILIGAMKTQEITPEQKKLGMFSKRFLRPAKPQEITWDKESPGTVTRVVKHGKNTTVYVNTQASATIGDKIVGRHGNKGIITHILPDHEMPKTMGGKVAEVLLNPTGLPTRINVGQVLETAAGKIAEKTGKPYTVNNFDPDNRDYTRNLMKELKVHGLKDTEEMVDPATGKPYGPVLFGPQYILKLHHTAAKGLSARSRHAYDSNMVPQRGGPNGGQTMDAMGMYALLAHNARENVREMQTYKSNNNDQFWEMIQSGDSPPTPKVPFVFKKFEGYLKGMGVDVQKEGNDIILQPLTDKKVLEMSNGELRNPNQSLRGKDLKPEPGGIFDPKATGTRGIASDLGTKWSHIKLAERMPNPVFESPIASLLALPRKHVGEIVAGKRELEGKTGPSAISDALKKVDVNKEAASLKAALPTMRTSNLNKANKKLKYLRALQKAGASPVDAYTMKYVPVLPPTMRPVALRDNGDLVHDSLNDLYTGIGKTNYQLKTMDPAMPEEEKNPLHEALYDGIRSLSLTGTESQGKHLNGIAEIIAGRGSPKEGFFQAKVIGRRQDLSMRGTIVPEPSLSLDEVAIPRKAAAEVYKPFVVANLVNRRGYSPLMAQQKVKEDGIEARSALDEVAAERPLLLKRDPVLHKYGVQAFKPRLVTGKAIKIHPLATTGYNADFDGDKMSAYVPVSQKAVKEAWKMLPSNNLFSPSTGFVMFKPTQESMQGLFKLTEMGKKTNKTFNTAGEAARAVKEGKIGLDDVITVKNFSGLPGLDKLAAAPKRTTVGRMMVYNALPSELRTDKVLTDKEFVLNKGKLQDLLTDVAALDKGSFGSVSDKLKDLGNARSTGLSIGLSDFLSDYEERDKILGQARKVENKIRASKLTPSKRDEKIVQLYIEAGKQIDAKAKAKAEAKPNRMYDWIRSGARGSWDNYKQMTVTPLLVADTQGKPIPVPIDRSYSEGLDIGSYWASMYGARMGTISRAEGTWRPGYMSKQMMQSTMNQMIVSDDCGTKKGMALPIDERDILGRYTANDIKLKKGKATEVIPAGTVIDPDIVNRLKNNRVTEVPVRTPLRCLHGKGMCSKCYGLNENGQLHQQGVNVGIIAAHALGEPATQLSMNSFHTGGVVGAKGTTAQGTFDRVNQLLQVPKILPGSATLAKADGKVDKIDKDPAGGWSVYVSGQRHYVPTTRDLAVKKGVTVKKGEAISTGVKNPRDMLPLTGMPTVQRYITDELHNIYQGVGSVKRRNTETFVRAMTNLSKVVDPGDHEDYLPGDTVPSTEVARYNSQKASESKPVRAEPLLHGVSVLPLEVQTDWLARMQATNLRSTILDAAAERWGSAVHSTHPIPGMAYGAEFGKGTPEKPWLY